MYGYRIVAIGLSAILALSIISSAAASPSLAPQRADPVRVMLLGDSITFGIGSPDGRGYRAGLWQALADGGYSVDFVGSLKGGPMPDPDNEGHSGWTIGELDAPLDAFLEVERPDVIVLMAGTNDAIRRFPGGAGRMQAMLEHISAKAPEARVLVSTLPPLILPDWNALVDTFNNELPGVVEARQAAGQKVTLANVGGSLTLGDLTPDGIHPSQPGYDKMAAAWYEALKGVL